MRLLRFLACPLAWLLVDLVSSGQFSLLPSIQFWSIWFDNVSKNPDNTVIRRTKIVLDSGRKKSMGKTLENKAQRKWEMLFHQPSSNGQVYNRRLVKQILFIFLFIAVVTKLKILDPFSEANEPMAQSFLSYQ